MSQEKAEIVRSVYEAWIRDDLPEPADLFDAQIEYVNPPGAVEHPSWTGRVQPGGPRRIRGLGDLADRAGTVHTRG